MIGDFLERMLTRCPWHLRAMGYLREAIGIRGRYRRCQQHWQSHIDHCHQIIRQAIGRCAKRRTAVVLGAGLLHDVPLVELSRSFQKILLVDIVHPFWSRWQTRRFKNVQRVSADVSNIVEELFWVSDEPDKPLPKSKPDLFLDRTDIDLTISINLLSQLPCMPMGYLVWHGAHTPEEIDAFARDVMQAHLDYLERLPGKVVLITDIERIKIDLSNRIVEVTDLLFGLKLPKAGEEWEWKLAPCPEADPRHHFYRRVVGIADF
ncbi:MAG: hypothetical protein K8T89_19375 [Planctomycetes bacterium]|nr:hypothetical protein [Planctomycetota bacterium]